MNKNQTGTHTLPVDAVYILSTWAVCKSPSFHTTLRSLGHACVCVCTILAVYCHAAVNLLEMIVWGSSAILFFFPKTRQYVYTTLHSERNTCFAPNTTFCVQNKRFLSHEENKAAEREWSGKNPFLSQKGFLWSPLSLCNLCHRFSPTSLTTFHPLILILFLLCLTSSHTPDRLLPLSIIVILLSSSSHAWPSPHHILLSYLSSLE